MTAGPRGSYVQGADAVREALASSVNFSGRQLVAVGIELRSVQVAMGVDPHGGIMP